ncbi:MAG: MtrB/PioB family decaheme-associated outer membrane protein [Pseudohongiellaceae bacterium]
MPDRLVINALAMLVTTLTAAACLAQGAGQAGGQAANPVAGTVSASLGHLNDDAYQYGNQAGVNEQGAAPWLALNLRYRPAPDSGDTAYWRIEGERLGLETPRFFLEVGQQGSQRLRVDFREIPRYRFDDARTPLQGAGTAVFTLPQNWQATGATTAGMSNLQESLHEVNLWQKRRSLELDYRRTLGPQWALDVDFRRDTVQGTRTLAGATGATGGNVRALLLPGPLDYETHSAGLSLAYLGDAMRWTLGYHGSFFSNGDRSVLWPTPFGAHPQWGAGVGHPDGLNRMALEPDNQAHQLRASGSYTITRRTRLYLDAVLGRQSQDEQFLPYTVNSQLAVTAALPRESLNARVNTSRLDLRLSSRPLSRLNLSTRIGYRDRDNRTPIAAYQRVRGDAVDQQAFADARLNRPYSLAEARASLEATWRFSSRLRLEAGYEFTDTDRDYSEVETTREHGVRLGLRSTQLDTLALALSYQHQRRRTDDYIGNRPYIQTHMPGTIDAEDFENHPLLRKYYLSERDRDQLRLHADWYPLSQLSLGAALAWNRDDYPTGYFGLNKSQVLSATFDVSYTPAEDFSVSAFYSRDRYRNDQSGRSFRGSVPADAFNPGRNWQVSATDHFETVGLNLEREQLQPRLGDWQASGSVDVSLQLAHSRSRGEIATEAGPALTNAPLPDLGTRLNTATMAARYHLSAQSSLRFALERELYRSSDFAFDNVEPDTLANVLLFGQDSPRYKATWVSLSYRYQY